MTDMSEFGAVELRAQLDRARSAASASGNLVVTEFLGTSVSEKRANISRLGALFDMRVLETVEMLSYTPAFDLLPLSRAMERRAALMRDPAGALLGVTFDPFDGDIHIWLESKAGLAPISFCIALESDIQAYLTKQEESYRAVESLSEHVESSRSSRRAELVSFASLEDSSSPAVRLVASTLYDALKAMASDVHLEATSGGLSVKYRIDGVLEHATSVTGVELAEQVISRLKILAQLDISERRVPQDGSFSVEAKGADIDLRVSIMPSIHGEDAVLRILDKRAMIEAYGSLSLEALGFDGASLQTLRQLSEEPYGMLLVTGPTGSGKTTTLYAALTEIHNGRDKIITIEDPVEYQLPGILQIPVNDKKGLTFARGLRSILRHDPDKIMVGEIRDRETAEIAIQSALTGHLVLTTVHANNVFDVFGRFTHMGIDPYAFVSALNGIWAQRLIRMNCPHCSRPTKPSEQALQRLGLTTSTVRDFRLMAGAGCGDCRGTGYRGRNAIAEFLMLNDEIRELVIEKAPLRQIKEAAARNGTKSLREAALSLAAEGRTTLEEIKRVTLHG